MIKKKKMMKRSVRLSTNPPGSNRPSRRARWHQSLDQPGRIAVAREALNYPAAWKAPGIAPAFRFGFQLVYRFLLHLRPKTLHVGRWLLSLPCH